MRARELGIVVGRGTPGPVNAITDVAGVRVGHATIVRGEGPLRVGEGPVRTGVTAVVPHDGNVCEEPLFAGFHRLNGNGELTGTHWVQESGMLKTPIGITNSHSVGVVRDALVAAEIAGRTPGHLYWSLPVVGETWDGMLNDIGGLHVDREHVEEALNTATDGPLPEGNVGGATGMICHGFKGGSGTASRVVGPESGGFTVGVLVQANHGRRERFQINGVPVGEILNQREIPVPTAPEEKALAQTSPTRPIPGPGADPAGSGGAGSIIAIVATDAPLLPNQCTRLAQRTGLGVARVGGVGEHWSGDLFFAFSTANRGMPACDYGDPSPLTIPLTMLSNAYIEALFDAVVEATEEAILNALLGAETMTGRDGVTAHRLDPERLVAILRKQGGLGTCRGERRRAHRPSTGGKR
jgi:D-aminopeptidase